MTTKVTVILTDEAFIALKAASENSGRTHTDVINQAIRLFAMAIAAKVPSALDLVEGGDSGRFISLKVVDRAWTFRDMEGR